jgi:hypothetical protein
MHCSGKWVKKMNNRLQDALENCLTRMEKGETLESVLLRYPNLTSQLSPLLNTALRARSGSREGLPQSVLARQRGRGLDLAAGLRAKKSRPWMLRGAWRISMTVLSVIAILGLSSNGLLSASAHSIPGDTLYPLKLSVETTQLHLTLDPAEKQVLERAFGERRVDETRSLISMRRIESVEFSGVVSSQSDSVWVVSGIPVIITVRTDLDDGIVVGDEIDVRGSTNYAGDVEAISLSLVNVPDPDDTPTQMAPKEAVTPDNSANLSVSPTETSTPESYSQPESNPTSGSEDNSSPSDHHSGEDSNSGDHSYDRGEEH